MATAVRRVFRELSGVVVSAGLADKTVRVTVGGQKWNRFLQKYFNAPETHLVHDPNNSLRKGDVVAITPGFRTSKHKRHVVTRIIAPAGGVPVEQRPPVPTFEERHDAKDAKREAKLARRAVNQKVKAAEAAIEKAALQARKTEKEISFLQKILESRRSQKKEAAAEQQ